MVDLFEKDVKAEASVGAKVNVGTVFAWVREKCFSVVVNQRGSEVTRSSLSKSGARIQSDDLLMLG
ncbi:MAG: hypothetical protein ACMZI2_04200 [Candidatus Symbiodolus clandestinus]